MSDTSSRTIAGAVWTCAAQFFVAQAAAQSRWTTPFSLSTNYISDLGNTTCGVYAGSGLFVCSPWHDLMNASFVLQGAIIMAGALLASAALGRGLSAYATVLLLWVTGVGMIGVGLFPEDVRHAAHVASAATQFVTGNAAMIVFGEWALRTPSRGFAWYSIFSGVAGLAATALFSQGYGLGLGVGGMERVAAYTLPVWLIASGIRLVRRGAIAAA